MDEGSEERLKSHGKDTRAAVRGKGRRPRGALLVGAAVALGVAGALLILALRGEAVLYRMVAPEETALAEAEPIPARLDAEAFQRDLDYLENELPRIHVAFEEAFDRASFEAEIDRLRADAATLSPVQREMELVRLLASGRVGTGHTMVFPFQRALGWSLVPVATYRFDDGLYVTEAGSAYQPMIGRRIEAIGGAAVEEILTRLEPYSSGDNEMSRLATASLLLGFREPLEAIGVAEADQPLRFRLEEIGEVEVESVPAHSLAGLRWARRVFAPGGDGWSPADPRPRGSEFVLEYDSVTGLIRLELNQIENRPDESIAELARRIDRIARTESVRKMVIDLRNNRGGNNEIGEPLVSMLSEHPVLDRKGTLYVLVGRRTFSAAANFAVALERRTKAIFAGERSGFAPSHYGDPVPMVFPGSRIVARVATRRWLEDLPGVRRESLEPELFVPFLSEHHFSDEDPVVTAVLRHDPESRNTLESIDPGIEGTYLVSPHHQLVISGENGAARLQIEAAGPYALTSLSRGAEGWPAGIADVEVRTAGDRLHLIWKGRSFEMTRVADDHRTPLMMVRAGELARGVTAFRETGGAAIGSDFELALNRIGYQFLARNETDRALLVFELNTELFPHSANVWDSFGEGLLRGGRVSEAERAYRRSVSIDPTHPSSMDQLERLADERR